MGLIINKTLTIKKGKKSYFVYLGNKLIIKQDFLRIKKSSFLYTFFFLVHLLVKLGMIKFI